MAKTPHQILRLQLKKIYQILQIIKKNLYTGKITLSSWLNWYSWACYRHYYTWSKYLKKQFLKILNKKILKKSWFSFMYNLCQHTKSWLLTSLMSNANKSLFSHCERRDVKSYTTTCSGVPQRFILSACIQLNTQWVCGRFIHLPDG